MSRLTLICGLPGSGKSTLARELHARTGALVLTPDEWMTGLGVDLWDEAFRARLELQLWSLAQAVLAAGVDVVLESGFWERSDREAKRTAAQAAGVAVELVVLDVPHDELWRRLRKRATPAGVTEELLRGWEQVIEWPDADELAGYDDVRLR